MPAFPGRDRSSELLDELPNTPCPNVIRIRLGLNAGCRVVVPLVEAYLARCGDGWIIVDTGPPASAPVILAAMKRHGISAKDVAFIVLTHGHFDHFGSAMALQRELGAHVRIAMHPGDRPFVTGESTPIRLRPTSLAGVLPILIGTLWMWLSTATGQFRTWTRQEAEQVVWLDEITGDDVADLESRLGVPLQAIHTPGHSAGSICLCLPTGELFTGDIISHGLLGNAPAWPLLADDPGQILPSLQRIAALRPGVVYPGHGAPMAGEAVVKLVRSITGN